MKLIYYGNPLLRKKSENIETVTEELRTLAQEMIAFMDKGNGIGLAAVQVGHLVRMFVRRFYIDGPDGEFDISPEAYVYINPKLSEPTPEKETHHEGCLSLPGFDVPVERPVGITVEALDIDGKPFKQTLTGYNARVIMHENDHLNGVLHIDRTDPASRKKVDPILQKIKAKYNP